MSPLSLTRGSRSKNDAGDVESPRSPPPTLRVPVAFQVTGLDGSGKSTMLYKLSSAHQPVSRMAVPIGGFDIEELKLANITLVSFDTGGSVQRQIIHLLLRDMLPAVSVIIFVVNSDDRELLERAREELDEVLKLDAYAHAPLLVLANMVDRPSALTPDAVAVAMRLQDIRGREVAVLPCSGLRGTGMDDALSWVRGAVASTTHDVARPP